MASKIPEKLYFKIGEACRFTSIQPYVLRYWETEFPALSPTKSKSGQRVYTRRELDVILRIKQLLYDEGYTIAGAKKKLEGELGGEPVADADEAQQPPLAESVAAPRAPADGAPSTERSGPRAVDTESGRTVQEVRGAIAAAVRDIEEILALLRRR